jgi:hypothetical protein
MNKKIKFFNLNIKHPFGGFNINDQSAAEFWLNSRRAPIFFGSDSVEQALSGNFSEGLTTKQKNEVLRFLKINEEMDAKKYDAHIVTIDSGFVWIYRLIGKPKNGEKVQFKRSNQSNTEESIDLPKYFDIELLSCEDEPSPFPISKVPYVLASMKSNPAFSRSTFAEIGKNEKYSGNLAAIQFLTGRWQDGFVVDPLDCLSSVEFETLLAKLFEDKGCFVPAYKGGFLRDIDFFATVPSDFKMSGMAKPAGEIISVQVKLKISDVKEQKNLSEWMEKSALHYLISLDSVCPPFLKKYADSGNYLTREWVRESIRKSRASSEWFERSTKWLPKQSMK